MLRAMFWIGWLAAAWADVPAVHSAEGAAGKDAVGNRLGYLEAFCDPFYPGLGTARLATPQWVGAEGVEAVLVLAIDDLRFTDPKERRPEHYEAYLRPILDRLKKIDGRTPVSLMTTWFAEVHPLFTRWLQEGCTLEVHTRTHACPLLQKRDFAAARASYEECVDQLTKLLGKQPVAFRMPCCDSMNSPSPRFYAELFNQRTAEGRFLQADSSVFLVFTSQDPALPRSSVLDESGQQRFRKYLPKDRLMGNYVENYPYPWTIDRLCWEVPAVMPSDWEAHQAHGDKNPKTVQDWKAAVDLVVAKQGVWAMCFHPYEWIANSQVLDVVEYAASRYAGKVLFLNFRELLDRLTQNALGGVPLRAADGQDNGVRLLDLNADGWMDVVIGNEKVRQTRLWSPKERRWIVGDFPAAIVQRGPDGKRLPTGVRFGVLRPGGMASILVRSE
ncbi:MAG TPA: polysaccharide deacetylase family protein, partial [Thermoguttaceae bacterium]|nr:polysaccharide deacetylase family protein [Thermoguttaceae bacterium]